MTEKEIVVDGLFIDLQSFAGQKLIRRGDFHVGGQVRSMVRLPQVIQEGDKYHYSRRHFCLCGMFMGWWENLDVAKATSYSREM